MRSDALGRSLFPSLGPVTASILFDGFEGGLPPPADPAVWAIELDALIRFRLAGVALSLAGRARLQLQPDTESRLRAAQRLDASLSMQAEATAQIAFNALDSANILYIVNKGPATARFHPQPGLRPYRDIDILVPPRQFRHALRTLESVGFADLDAQVQPRRFFTVLCREGVNLSSGEGSLDLHHVIPPWIWGERLGFEDLMKASETLTIGTRSVAIVGSVDGLIATALHLLSDRLHPGRELMIWRDLLAFVRNTTVEGVVERAETLGLAPILGFVLGSLPRPHRPEHLVQMLNETKLPRIEAVRLKELLSSRASGHQLSYFYRLPVANSIAFAYGYLVPSKSFLVARYGGKRAKLIRWWRDAVRSVPPA